MTIGKDHDVSIARVNEALSYNSAPGALAFTWRQRPRWHFKDEAAWKRWNTRYAGRPAGSVNNYGYQVIELVVDGRRRRLSANRVASAISTSGQSMRSTTGTEPSQQRF